MVNRIKNRQTSSNEEFTHSSGTPGLQAEHMSLSRGEPVRFDDLIGSLANERENRRARQVVEWEQVRRRTFPLSV